MKKALKRSLSLLLAITIIFSSAYVGLGEVDFGKIDLGGLFAVKAQAARESDLTFYLNDDGESYSVTDCDASVSGSLIIPSTYNNLPVTSIGSYAFYYCTSLTSVTIPDSVTSIGSYAFCDCSSLNSVTIGSSVTSIGNYAFRDCTSLINVYITDLAAWCSIEFVDFSSNPLCYAAKLYINGELATDIVIPDGVTTVPIYAFSCENIVSVTIPDSVTSIGDHAFLNCDSLTNVYITDLAAWCGIAFYHSYSNPLYYAKNLYVNGELATDIVIPDGVTTIPKYAFSCENIVSVTIPNSVTSIGGSAFHGCKSLTSVTIGNGVTSIGVSAFEDCTSLTSITIPNSVTFIDFGAFKYCTSLNSVTIGNGVTSIGDYAFEDCTNLTSVTIGNSVTSIGVSAFEDCTSLTSITIPNSVTSIGVRAFEDCTNLTSVTIGNSVTSIGNYAFYYCTSLTSVTIGNSVTSIGNYAFYYCTSLASITIPDSVTSIGVKAFKDCTSLTSITIPNSVTSIGSYAFKYCSKLTIYGIPGSYAETYAKNNSIPFKDISGFGRVNLHVMAEAKTTFWLFDKNAVIEYDGVDVGLEDVYKPLYNATADFDGEEPNYCSEKFSVPSSDFVGEIVFYAPDYQDYFVPSAVMTSLKVNAEGKVDVYMTKDHKDGKPYISTVFGRVYDEDCENTYEELQTNSLNILKDETYDIIISANLIGETSATYYLSQDVTHRISSETGVFSQTELYSKFDANKPIYAYAVTSSGKVTEPVGIQMKKIVCSDAVTKLFSSPKINLLGEDYTKLTISDNIPLIGGAELSMNFIEIPFGFEVEGERVRISLGADFAKYSSETTTTNGKKKTKKEKWLDFKKCCRDVDKALKSGKNVTDKYKAFEKAKKQRGFGSNNIQTTKKSNFDVGASYLGYIEGHLVDGNLVITEFCGSVAAELVAQYTVNGSIGPVPAYFYVQGGGEFAVSLGLAKTIPDPNVPIDFDFTLGFTGKGKVGGGVGTKGVVSGGIYGTLKIPFAYEVTDKHLTLSIAGSVGVEGEILFFEGKKELISGTWNAIDKYFGVSEASLGDFSEAVYSEVAEVVHSGTPKVTYSLASRDYAESTSGWLGYTADEGENSGYMPPFYGSATTPDTTVTELQTSVYKNSQTQLVQFGDKIMLAYIEDCAERDTYNRYRLMYTIYNPSTNTWTQPKAVCDSGKMDVAPSLATDGNNVYIAWQTVKTNPTAATEEELYKAMNNMEIYSAKYDVNSDSFVNVTQHTNNSTYDYSPYVTIENGSATVYWVNAKSLDYAIGEMSIHSSKAPNNTPVYSNLNYVTSVKASGNDISYSMDVDGDLNTVNDIKFFTNGVQVGEGVVADTAVVTNFTYGDLNGKETLFYSDGGTVYYVENGTSVAAFSDNGGVADSLLITNLNGNPAVVYTQLTDMGSELRISTLEDEKWSEPVYLTDIGCALSNVDVVSMNGKVYSVFDRTQTTAITDEETEEIINFEYGKTDLCMLTSEGYFDLEISNIGFDEGDVLIGDSVPVIVVMENKGTETITNVGFTISDTLGYSKSITKDISLAPGAIESIELDYIAPEGYTKSDLTVVANIVDESDVDTTNNTTSTQIGRTDISVGAISVERVGDIFKITGEVKNDSLVDAENVNANISFGFFKKDVALGTMAVNSTNMVELLIAKNELVFDENNICTLKFSISTDSEEIVLGNNENTVTVDNSEKLVEHVHNFVDGVCDSCGIPLFLHDVLDEGIVITGYAGTDTELLIPETINGLTVTAIGDLAFAGNETITSVVIPASVKTIGENAFGESNVLKYFFFAGSESDWEKVSIGENNKPLTDAIIHFNSTDHSYEEKIDAEATCTEDGSKHQECSVCGYSLGSESISALGHDYSTEWTIDKVVTCTEDGSKSRHCIVCGDNTDVTIVPASGHTPSKWIIDKNATVNATGSKHKECTVCGKKLETAVIPQLKPSTPKLSSVANTPTGVKFVWGKVTGADSYVVYRRTYNASTKKWSGWVNIAKGVKTNSYLDKTAKSGTYYIYTVRAGNEAGYSGYNATGLKIYFLSTPTLASVTNSSTGVTVKWGKVTGATNYVVYRRAYNTTTKKWSGWTNLGKTTATSFADKTAKSGNYYIYTVKALAGTYTSSYNTTGLKTYFLSIPALSKVASTTSGVKFTWGKVTGASGYIVYRKTYNATTKTWGGWTNLGKTTSASFVDKSAKKGTYYVYTTKAYYGSYTSYYNTTGLKVKDIY